MTAKRIVVLFALSSALAALMLDADHFAAARAALSVRSIGKYRNPRISRKRWPKLAKIIPDF